MYNKLLPSVILVVLLFLLTPCVPDGMSSDFYNQATEIFYEIDDDTAEMEMSDTDDLLKFKLLQRQAVTSKEKAVADLINQMINLQDNVVKGDRQATKDYIQVRQMYEEFMEFDVGDF